MMIPLPSMEEACAMVQQEESQKKVLGGGALGDNDVLAMYSRGNGDKNLVCTGCGRKGHSNDKC